MTPYETIIRIIGGLLFGAFAIILHQYQLGQVELAIFVLTAAWTGCDVVWTVVKPVKPPPPATRYGWLNPFILTRGGSNGRSDRERALEKNLGKGADDHARPATADAGKKVAAFARRVGAPDQKPSQAIGGFGRGPQKAHRGGRSQSQG